MTSDVHHGRINVSISQERNDRTVWIVEIKRNRRGRMLDGIYALYNLVECSFLYNNKIHSVSNQLGPRPCTPF